MSAFALLSFLQEQEENYLGELEDIIWAICNKDTRDLPAHLGGKSLDVITDKNIVNEQGKIKSHPRKHRHTIDLFATETAFTLLEIISLLEQKLSSLVCYRAREEIYERIFKLYIELNNIFHWELLPMNWAAVCSGSIGAAAIYLIEENDVLAAILQRVLNAMEIFLSGFGNDGSCREGLGCWNYGFGFYRR